MKLEGRGSCDGLRTALFAFFGLIAASLQGCDLPRVEGYFAVGDMSVTTHRLSVWRSQPSYYDKFAHWEPVTQAMKFNSCMDNFVKPLDVCSGRGKCMPFLVNDLSNPFFVCQCDYRYGDPECGTKRKSQAVAWLLSLTTGYLGFDQFYLGYGERGFCKCMVAIFCLVLYVLGGETGTVQRTFAAVLFGGIWLFDVVRIGAAPVYAKNFATAPDLPRWAFSVLTLTFMLILGIMIGLKGIYMAVTRRRRKATALSYGISSGPMAGGLD